MMVIWKVIGMDELTSGKSSHRDKKMTQSSKRGRDSNLYDRKVVSQK